MSNGVIAFLIAASTGTWIFSKEMRKTGNETRSSFIVAVIAGSFIFVLSFLLLNLVPKG